jgi:hypothetical protein
VRAALQVEHRPNVGARRQGSHSGVLSAIFRKVPKLAWSYFERGLASRHGCSLGPLVRFGESRVAGLPSLHPLPGHAEEHAHIRNKSNGNRSKKRKTRNQ